MDGENDFRKITVSHFLALAVAPTLPAQPSSPPAGMPPHAFVHFMWPGFVAVASGVNSGGLYVMMNDGQSNPAGPLARRLTPFGWVVRQMLRRAETVEQSEPIAAEYASDQGGACVAR